MYVAELYITFSLQAWAEENCCICCSFSFTVETWRLHIGAFLYDDDDDDAIMEFGVDRYPGIAAAAYWFSWMQELSLIPLTIGIRDHHHSFQDLMCIPRAVKSLAVSFLHACKPDDTRCWIPRSSNKYSIVHSPTNVANLFFRIAYQFLIVSTTSWSYSILKGWPSHFSLLCTSACMLDDTSRVDNNSIYRMLKIDTKAEIDRYSSSSRTKCNRALETQQTSIRASFTQSTVPCFRFKSSPMN